MLKSIFFGYLLLCFTANGEALIDKCVFASVDKAKQLLTTKDQFTERWSQFDIDSRLHKTGGTKEELFKYISSQVREWTEDEKYKISLQLKSIGEIIIANGYKIKLPPEIYFVKTTADEEGGAGGYTRATYIVLKKGLLDLQPAELKELIIHELFHVLSRFDPELKKKMYGVIGFTIMNEISYPNSIKNVRITNPDCPLTDSYIKLKKDSAEIECAMVLYADKNYEGGSFFKYLKVGFLVLKGKETKEINYINKVPQIYTLKEVANFSEQVGKNTGYIINPEEVLADNFQFVIMDKTDLKSQWLIDKMKQKLKE